MGFESTRSDQQSGVSPGGFEFGLQGWSWGEPIPKSITFFLDGTAMVCDQYGRQIRRCSGFDGKEYRFADTPPIDNQEKVIVGRPQFASHAEVIAALASENIDWLSYEVRYFDQGGAKRVKNGLKLEDATKLQHKLLAEGKVTAVMSRSIVCAGWPQLPYDELKKLPELPPTPIAELARIRDLKLRKDALRIRREVDEVGRAEMAAEEAEVGGR